MALVFISHAGADKSVADALVDLLQTGCDLRVEEVSCSSVEGAGIASGEEFIDWIQENIESATLVVLLLTPNYYASKFCLAEMGAAWALKKRVFPLMHPGLSRDPGVIFLGRQAARLDGSGLDNLKDEIDKNHPAQGTATARWSIKKDSFLKRLDALLASLSSPDLVERHHFDQERQRAAAATQLVEEMEGQVAALKERVRQLELATSAEEVREIKSRFEPALKIFDDLCKEIRDALSDLTRVEVRGIYAAVSGDEWTPVHDTWERYDPELQKAVKSRWLHQIDYSSGQTTFTANEEHPRLQPVFALINELRRTIEALSDDDKADLEKERGYLVDLDNWEFWEEALLWSSLLD